MVCVRKETNACSHMRWQTASHPPSARTLRRAPGLGKGSLQIQEALCCSWWRGGLHLCPTVLPPRVSTILTFLSSLPLLWKVTWAWETWEENIGRDWNPSVTAEEKACPIVVSNPGDTPRVWPETRPHFYLDVIRSGLIAWSQQLYAFYFCTCCFLLLK